MALACAAALLLSACAQNNSTYSPPERGDADFVKGKDTRADELYLNSNAPAGGRDYRNVYIAPVNFDSMQVVAAGAEASDASWAVTPTELANAQAIVRKEFAAALSYHSAFNIVDSAEAAEIVVSTRIVALHPNASRAEVDAGAKRGGAVTVSLALRDAASGDVLVRSVDTKSTDDIWAFNQIENDEGAISLIFRSWGNSMRRGILALQGRTSDPLAPSITVQQQ